MKDNEIVVSNVTQVFTKNRAEQIGMDVWGQFVIPQFYTEGTFNTEMPSRIEGGRGSGKTMILRYLSYYSQFSTRRKEIPKSCLSKIGLYWKADTQFLRMMQKRGQNEEQWYDIFSHYVTLKLAREVVSCVSFISESNCSAIIDLKEFEFLELQKLLDDMGFSSRDLIDFSSELKTISRKTDLAVKNIRKGFSIKLLPLSFLKDLLEVLCTDISWLNKSTFCVYVDEYENLLPYQQRTINTEIKHSESPLIFNVAIKRNGMAEKGTLGDEQLENRADYKIVDIDRMMKDINYEVYFAEIFLRRIADVDGLEISGFNDSILTDFEQVSTRKKEEYSKNIKKLIGDFLPIRSHDDLANDVFEIPAYRRKLVSIISRALQKKGSKLDPNDFIDDQFRKASIVNSSLLNRYSIDCDVLRLEFKSFVSGKDSKYKQPTDWVHNNFIGSYLNIITSNKNKCSFYSGYDVYMRLSDGNVRHFLEMCRTAFSLVDVNLPNRLVFVDNVTQNVAARITAEELYKEVVTFTPKGRQLQNLVFGLGTLFSDYQKRESQSEPEVTHFYLMADTGSDFDDEVINLLAEAEKWGVLRRDTSTKAKSGLAESDYEYVLNPVYSPFFGISYRKNRRISITIEDFKNLCNSGSMNSGKSMDANLPHPRPVQGDLL